MSSFSQVCCYEHNHYGVCRVNHYLCTWANKRLEGENWENWNNFTFLTQHDENEFQWTCLQLLSNSSRHPTISIFSQVQKNFEASFSFHLFVLGCFFHWRKCVPWESLTSLEVLNSAATLCIITRHKRVWTHFLQAAKMFTNGSA